MVHGFEENFFSLFRAMNMLECSAIAKQNQLDVQLLSTAMKFRQTALKSTAKCTFLACVAGLRLQKLTRIEGNETSLEGVRKIRRKGRG